MSDIRSGRFLAGLACAAAVFLLGGFFGVGKSLAGGKSLRVDPQFGVNGTARIDSDLEIDATDLVMEATGGVAFTATVYPNDGYMPFAVGRLGSGGETDGTFGDDGLTFPSGMGNSDTVGEAIDISPDGKLVAVGYEQHGFGSVYPLVYRLSADGSEDKSFRPQGRFAIENLGFDDLAVLPDRSVVAVGETIFRGNHGIAVDVVRKYRPNGKLDRNFGNKGDVRLKGLEGEVNVELRKVVLDGTKILVAGSRRYHFFVARLNSQGELDRSFGKDGVVTVRRFSKRLCDNALACHISGLTVFRHRVKVAFQGPVDSYPGWATTVVGLRQNGKIDRSFGKRGRVHVAALSRDMASPADGSLVLLAQRTITPRKLAHPGLVHIWHDGRIDERFNKSLSAKLPDADIFDSGAVAAAGNRITVAVLGKVATVRRLVSR